MTVYFDKRRGKWVYDFERRGARYYGYCIDAAGSPCTSDRSAREAEAIEKRKVAIAPKLPSAQGMTLASALASLTPRWEAKPCWADRKRYVREIVGFFGPGTRMADIGESDVERYRAHCVTAPISTWMGGPGRDPTDPANEHYWKVSGRKRGPNTANLYLGVLRQVLEHAGRVRDPRTGEPALKIVPDVKDFDIPRRKARPIPDDVLSEILPNLPQHVVEAATLTLFFGFRRGEVLNLQVSNVDFAANGVRLFAEDVKDNEDAFLPGGPEAMAYLTLLAQQATARGTRHLITWRPYRKDPEKQEQIAWRPLKRSKSAWTKAMDVIEARHGRRWRWHDIRAAFITHVALTSGQLAAQAMARHSDYDTTRAYVEVADELRRGAAARAAHRPALAVIHGGRSPSTTAPGNPQRAKRGL